MLKHPAACRSATSFRWEDGSPSPNVVPSGQNFSGPGGWSHWGLRSSSTYAEPDNGTAGIELCAAALDLRLGSYTTYDYFNGSSQASKSTAANYIRRFSRQDLLAWADVACNSSYAAICELTSEGAGAWMMACAVN